jgi:nitrate reductase gamma subunit
MNATREILWNLNTLPNVVGLYGLLVVALAIGLNGVLRRAELWTSGKSSDEHLGSWFSRLDDLIQSGFFQKKVARGKGGAPIAHLLVYVGFLVLLFTTTMVFIHHDLGIKIYQGQFYLYVTMFSDIFGILLLGGILYFGYRRFIQRADLVHNTPNDVFILAMLALLVVQGFVLEGLRIHATNDPWALYSPIGWLFAKSVWFLPESQAKSAHFVTWWFHTLTVYAFVALFPYTKFFHMLTSPLNLFFARTERPKGALEFIGDLEKMMESGEEFSLARSRCVHAVWTLPGCLPGVSFRQAVVAQVDHSRHAKPCARPASKRRARNLASTRASSGSRLVTVQERHAALLRPRSCERRILKRRRVPIAEQAGAVIRSNRRGFSGCPHSGRRN